MKSDARWMQHTYEYKVAFKRNETQFEAMPDAVDVARGEEARRRLRSPSSPPRALVGTHGESYDLQLSFHRTLRPIPSLIPRRSPQAMDLGPELSYSTPWPPPHLIMLFPTPMARSMLVSSSRVRPLPHPSRSRLTSWPHPPLGTPPSPQPGSPPRPRLARARPLPRSRHCPGALRPRRDWRRCVPASAPSGIDEGALC